MIEHQFEIKLLEHTFNVYVENVEKFEPSNYGKANLCQQSIRINANLPRDLHQSTLIHELIHMISDMHSFDLPETQIDCLANGFLSLIRNNRKLIEEMFDR